MACAVERLIKLREAINMMNKASVPNMYIYFTSEFASISRNKSECKWIFDKGCKMV
jgi:hypothetical protein